MHITNTITESNHTDLGQGFYHAAKVRHLDLNKVVKQHLTKHGTEKSEVLHKNPAKMKQRNAKKGLTLIQSKGNAETPQSK